MTCRPLRVFRVVVIARLARAWRCAVWEDGRLEVVGLEDGSALLVVALGAVRLTESHRRRRGPWSRRRRLRAGWGEAIAAGVTFDFLKGLASSPAAWLEATEGSGCIGRVDQHGGDPLSALARACGHPDHRDQVHRRGGWRRGGYREWGVTLKGITDIDGNLIHVRIG